MQRLMTQTKIFIGTQNTHPKPKSLLLIFVDISWTINAHPVGHPKVQTKNLNTKTQNPKPKFQNRFSSLNLKPKLPWSPKR